MNDPSPSDKLPEPTLSSVVIPLLKGVVYAENTPELWNQLTLLEPRVRDYIAVLNLDLILDHSEGYAFLRSREMPESDDDGATKTGIPRLYARRPLSFPVSLLLVLLRKKLAESDIHEGGARLVLSLHEIAEMLRVFLPAHTNEARLVDQVESHLNKVIDLGFIRRLKAPAGSSQPAVYEVRRILRAFIDAQWLADFDTRLEEYRQHLEAPSPDTDHA